MKVLSASSPVRTASGIDLMVEFDELGVVPYHATPGFNPGTYEEEIYNNAVSGVYGEIAPYSPPVLTAEQKKQAVIDMVQAHLDAAAQAYGYGDIKSAVTYADEPAVAVFQTQGVALRAWRSLVWEKCYALLAQVEAGEIAEPSGDELIAMLPSLSMPA